MRDKEGVRGRGTRRGGRSLTGVIAVKAGNSSDQINIYRYLFIYRYFTEAAFYWQRRKAQVRIRENT